MSSTRETENMAYITKIIQLSDVPETSLAEFIARRRAPGPDWRSWEGVVIDLHEVTGRVVSIATIRSWAVYFGIPDATRLNGEYGGTSAEQYANAISRAGITIH